MKTPAHLYVSQPAPAMRENRRRPVEQPHDAIHYALEICDAGIISKTAADILNLGEGIFTGFETSARRLTYI